MKIILNNTDLSKTLGPFNDIGFVPTMGGIHEGHISLIKRSIKYNKKTITLLPYQVAMYTGLDEVGVSH